MRTLEATLCVQHHLGLLLGQESLPAEPNGRLPALVVAFAAGFDQLLLFEDLAGGHVDLDVVQAKLPLAGGGHVGHCH